MKKEDGFATTLVPLDKIRPPLFQCRIESLDQNLEELANSIKEVGLLQPLTIRFDKDKEPELVLGSRRLKACIKAGLEMVPVIIRDLTDEQALEIEGVENLDRNDLTDSEKTRLCVEWAKRENPKTKKPYTATEIPEKVHRSYSWVVSFLPSEFKDQKRADAGKLGGEAKSATIAVAKSQELKPECERCHVSGELQDWEGHKLCQKCRIFAGENPAQVKRYFELRDHATKKLGKKVPDDQLPNLILCGGCGRSIGIMNAKAFEVDGKAVDLCPSCYDKAVHSKEERKARMSDGVSTMDRLMLVRLQNNQALKDAGWHVEFQKHYVVLELVSDVTLTNGVRELPFFWDGIEIHKADKADRDETNRALLRKHHPELEVKSVAYKGNSEKEQLRLEQFVLEAVEK